MLKNHPKGLLVAFFSNMGERFGFYTMMAILVLFLQAKYGLSPKNAGDIYSWFYFSIYALALLGGIIADATKKYKLIILTGILMMFVGYIIMALPGMSLTITIVGLMIIALGNGMFKGNLQAVVGQMYDDPKYSKLRDTAFMIFYMGINVGAFFAPFAANGIRNWWLKVNGFAHDGSLPALCHWYNGILNDSTIVAHLNDTTSIQQVADSTTLQQLADTNAIQHLTDSAALHHVAFTDSLLNSVDSTLVIFRQLADSVNFAGPVTDLTSFSGKYINTFSTGYNYAFGIAAGAMILSLLVYIIFNRYLPNKEKKVTSVVLEKVEFKLLPIIAAIVAIVVTAFGLHFIKQFGDTLIQRWATSFAIGLFAGFVTWIFMTAKKEERGRITALVLVFVVVIFFWMSFHQNGLTLTMFARDYTVKKVGAFTNLFFTLPSMLAVIGVIAGVVMLVYRKVKPWVRITGGGVFTIGILIILNYTIGFDPLHVFRLFLKPFEARNSISPELFQPFNPLFIVALTFPVMAAFAWMNKKGIEPSTPKKIGIGMVIAAFGFVVMFISSYGAPSPESLKAIPIADIDRVSPYWLISTYFVLTIAELFLSPMGLSFVSKVAPSRFQGLMQGGWLLATAVGNKLLFIGTVLWEKVNLSAIWLLFIVCCFISAAFIFIILKRLEKAASS